LWAKKRAALMKKLFKRERFVVAMFVVIILCLVVPEVLQHAETARGSPTAKETSQKTEEDAWINTYIFSKKALVNFLAQYPSGKYATRTILYISLCEKMESLGEKKKKPEFVIPFEKLGHIWEQCRKINKERKTEKAIVGLLVGMVRGEEMVGYEIRRNAGPGPILIDIHNRPILPTKDGSIIFFKTDGLKYEFLNGIVIQGISDEAIYFGVIEGIGLVHLRGRGKVITPDGKEVELPARQKSKIAFTSYRDLNDEVYVMNADGTEQTNLTRHPAMDGAPSWSPDGQRIAFVSTRDGNLEIYVMNADGSRQQRLTNNPASDNSPKWSLNGKKIAFASERDGNSEIYIMNAEGGQQKRLTNNSAFDAIPSWSPDGKRIAFNSDRDGNLEIYVMNADGSKQRRLTNNIADDGDPSWSPDGKKIAFSSGRDGNPEVYVINANGRDQRRLTKNTAIDGAPSWSPDGEKIVFMSYRDGNDEIYVMNADGTKQTNLSVNRSIDSYPSWSPFIRTDESNRKNSKK